MGPLAGIRLIEVAGIGPGPMAAMMLVLVAPSNARRPVAIS